MKKISGQIKLQVPDVEKEAYPVTDALFARLRGEGWDIRELVAFYERVDELAP